MQVWTGPAPGSDSSSPFSLAASTRRVRCMRSITMLPMPTRSRSGPGPGPGPGGVSGVRFTRRAEAVAAGRAGRDVFFDVRRALIRTSARCA